MTVRELFELCHVAQPVAVSGIADWKEGHNMLGRDGPVEVPLLDNNAAALKLICAIIHHRNKRCLNLAAGDVLGIAVTADKPRKLLLGHGVV